MSRGVPLISGERADKGRGHGRSKGTTDLVPVSDARAELPPILAGRHTAAVEAKLLPLRRRHSSSAG